jgi:hypothetical protein
LPRARLRFPGSEAVVTLCLPAQVMRQCVDDAGQPCAVTVTATVIPRKSELAPV